MNTQIGTFKKILHTDLLFIVIFIIINAAYLKLIFQPYQSLNGYLEENTLFNLFVCGWVIYAILPTLTAYIHTRSFKKSFLALIRFQILIILTALLVVVLTGVYFVILYNTALFSDPIAIGLLITILICIVLFIGLVFLYKFLIKKSLTKTGRKILLFLIPLYILFVFLSFFVLVYSTALGTAPMPAVQMPSAMHTVPNHQ